MGRKIEKTAERRRKMCANVDKEAGIQIKMDKQVPAGSRVCCLAYNSRWTSRYPQAAGYAAWHTDQDGQVGTRRQPGMLPGIQIKMDK